MNFLTDISIVVLSAVGAALGAYLKEYFSSRGRKEGELDAVARNLDEVVRQLRETTKAAEEVRAAVSAGLWVDQERWKLKRDAYLTLLDSLQEFAWIFIEAKLRGNSPREQGQVFSELLSKGQNEKSDRVNEVRRALLVARLFMTPEAFEAIERLTNDVAATKHPDYWDAGHSLDQLMAASKRAFDLLVNAAKLDLALAPKNEKELDSPHAP